MCAGEGAVAGARVQADQLHVGVVVANVDFDLFIGPRNKERSGITGDGDFAPQRQAGGGANQRLFGDTHVDQTTGKFLHKRGNFRRRRGVSNDGYNVHSALDCGN